MKERYRDILETARSMGFSDPENHLYAVRDWLRENHEIHIEVGSIWDEKNNYVESYFHTITTPVHKYHLQPQYYGNGTTHMAMLSLGVAKGLHILEKFEAQKHLEVSDDKLVVAYLKGYGEKEKKRQQAPYVTNVEEYAYTLGKQGDYIEEGLTDEDIVNLVRNPAPKEEQLKLK